MSRRDLGKRFGTVVRNNKRRRGLSPGIPLAFSRDRLYKTGIYQYYKEPPNNPTVPTVHTDLHNGTVLILKY